jgi:hypothetical protein
MTDAESVEKYRLVLSRVMDAMAEFGRMLRDRDREMFDMWREVMVPTIAVCKDILKEDLK